MEQQARSWSHLPDVCLLLIFKKLSLRDLIRSVGRVCTNWALIQRVELQNRTSVVIVGERAEGEDDSEERLLSDLRSYSNPFGSDMIEHVRREDGTAWAVLRPLEQFKFDIVRVSSDSFTKGNIAQLMDRLPNITHLTVKLWHECDWPISYLEQVTRLVNHYSASLVSLRIEIIPKCTRFEHPRTFKLDPALPNTMLALFDSINRLESLRQLTLSVMMHNSVEPRLSILTRLTTFNSIEFEPAQSLVNALRQYATGDDLRIECDTTIDLNDLTRLEPQLASKFTRVRVGASFLNLSNYESMRLFCQRFVSLHSLMLDHIFIITPMTMLARCLSQLPNLIHLKMYFFRIPQDERPPPPEIAQVPSVRLITLSFLVSSHADTERFHLAQIFPKLQVLKFYYQIRGFCNECRELPRMHPQIVRCHRLVRRPFRACTNLHTIKLNTNDERLQTLLPHGMITRDEL